MKYIIIGLGNYGSVLAEELSALGHEVIGVDTNERRVDVLKDKIATSFIIDATDEQSLSVLPLKDVDVVIVAIGENFGASIRVVALLKKNGVKHIYARAVDEVHKTVLEAFNLDSILTPEEEAARSLVQLLDLHVNVESFEIDEEHYVMKFKLPGSFVGYKVSDLSLEKEFNIKIIALVKGNRYSTVWAFLLWSTQWKINLKKIICWKKKTGWYVTENIKTLWISGKHCNARIFFDFLFSSLNLFLFPKSYQYNNLV